MWTDTASEPALGGSAPEASLVEPSHAETLMARAYAPAYRFFTLWGVWVAGLLFLLGFVGGYFGYATGALHLAGLYALACKLLPILGQVEGRGFGIQMEAGDVTLHLPGREPLRLSQADAYYECPGCLVVTWPSVGELILPGRAFSPIHWQQVLNLVRDQAKPQKAIKKHVLEALGLTVAMGLTVFWAWGFQR